MSVRTATLVLVTRDGTVLGQLPPFPVATPWWNDVGPVVTAARERGTDLTVLRLLACDPSQPNVGGPVTYLCEVERDVPGLEPWSWTLAEDPLRMPWARPGGPAADLAWADTILGGARTGPPVQIRTWNLSSLWSLPTVDGAAWLKVVPPFFAHEGAVLELLAGEAVPRLLGHDGSRTLTAEIPGVDCYRAPEAELIPMVAALVRIQARELGNVDRLLALGLPDLRGPTLTERITDVVERTALDGSDRRVLDTFVRSLPERFSELSDCGLPDGLVHGDFHPGNVRSDDGRLTLLDWADSGVGHPLLDLPAFLECVPVEGAARVRGAWVAAWREAVPGSDPERAAASIAPIAAARQAAIYRGFLDRIEVSERPYHQPDPATWLRRTVEILS